MTIPYLTADLPGTGGRIKTKTDDFIVREIPLYPASGQGIHVYFTIEKRGISTLSAVNMIARALGRKTMEIGYAGLKDTQAVARQTFSIEHESHTRIAALELPQIRILEVTRHQNKLKIGHLAGNHFTIKIRNDQWAIAGGSVADAGQKATAVLQRLATTGVPNFFGPQRFGMRGDNHQLGLSLLRGRSEEFLNRWLGDPDPQVDHGGVLEARRHFANGNLDLAVTHWPGHLREERRALGLLARHPKKFDQAMRLVDIRLKRLLISALQAHLFNETLAMRLDQINTILPGDLAWKHDIGAVFRVENSAAQAAVEQPRCDAHEISPSGPMFGYRMTEPEGEPGHMEKTVLEKAGLKPSDFHSPRAEKSKGSRRAMRFFPSEMTLHTGTDDLGPFLELIFALPPGCFATVLLGEIMKTDVPVD